MKVWVMTDGKPGMQNQALGLAEALGSNVTVKHITTRAPWKWLAPFLRIGLSHCVKGDPLTPPWPDVAIASGRMSILPALYVKQASNGKTKIIYIQKPGIAPAHFTAVVVPEHDRLTAANVVVTQGALHRVTDTRLMQEAAKFEVFSKFPSPRVAVILGGTNRTYRFTPDAARQLGEQLKTLKATLMITPSRRTDRESLRVLTEALQGKDAYIWDGKGENPYFGMLAWADALLVTCDSISMLSEARATSKPVYMIRLPGGDAKFQRFHTQWLAKGYVKWFDGVIEFNPSDKLNEVSSVAERLKAML